MGTSGSSSGPGANSPLIPPWADDSPGQAQPEPIPQRHREFRTALGRSVKNRDALQRKRALGHYARSTTGGKNAAVRRMGSVTSVGGQLFNVLTGGTEADVTGQKINLSSLKGLSCDAAIDQIITSLTPNNGDSDKIRTAMNHALSEALQGVEIFDPKSITEEIIISTMIAYLTENIFIQLMLESGNSFDQAEDGLQLIQAENALKELVNTEVDLKMSKLLSSGIKNLSPADMIQLQKDAIKSIWETWENYEQ